MVLSNASLGAKHLPTNVLLCASSLSFLVDVLWLVLDRLLKPNAEANLGNQLRKTFERDNRYVITVRFYWNKKSPINKNREYSYIIML